MRQLDGLRALSVAAVAWSHWRPDLYSSPWLSWGELGVETFFVISGFLITGILLDNRSETERPFILRQFYIRRALRIFPLFYLTLLVACLFQAHDTQAWPWHAGYLSNVYIYLHGWGGRLGHFWSLAVEEQFYLCWPFLMIFLPRRFLLPAVVAAIGIAPIFELAMARVSHSSDAAANLLMPSCLDALGMGALLAVAGRNGYPVGRIANMILAAGIVGRLLCHVFHAPDALGRLADDGILGWLVYRAAEGFSGMPGRILQCRPLVYLGKISYGLYIFHNLAGSLWDGILAITGDPHWLTVFYQQPACRVVANAALTIALASYSWHRFEQPLNALKRKFPYPKEQPPAAAVRP